MYFVNLHSLYEEGRKDTFIRKWESEERPVPFLWQADIIVPDGVYAAEDIALGDPLDTALVCKVSTLSQDYTQDLETNDVKVSKDVLVRAVIDNLFATIVGEIDVDNNCLVVEGVVSVGTTVSIRYAIWPTPTSPSCDTLVTDPSPMFREEEVVDAQQVVVGESSAMTLRGTWRSRVRGSVSPYPSHSGIPGNTHR